MKIVIFLLFLVSSCTITKDNIDNSGNNNIGNNNGDNSDLPESLVLKAQQYPAFNIRISGFTATRQIPDGLSDDQDKVDAQILTIEEKRFFLQAIDQIRFVINTPEFFEAMKNRRFIAGEDFSGPNGTIRVGEAYPSNERLYNVIKAKIGSAFITKLQLDPNVVAQANVPIRNGKIVNAYVAADNDPIFQNDYHVQFNNRKKWTSQEFMTINGSSRTDGFFQNIVFHELLHNLGFSHQDPFDINTDTVYQLGSIMEELLNDPLWRLKYSHKLASFEPFYPTLHQNYLTSDTLSSTRFAQQNDDLVFIPYLSPQKHNDNIPIVEKGYYQATDGSEKMFIRESFVFQN